MAECKSNLVQKYDVSREFTSTDPYSPQKIYNAADRVYLDAPAYAVQAYALGALALQAGKVYICTTVINAGEAFNAAHWTLLGNQYDLFFASFPFPLFSLMGMYIRGNQVYWNGHIYTALASSIVYDQETLIQFGTTNNIPYSNIFPDNPNSGPKYWGDNGAYTVPIGSLLDTTKFTPGDNRDQQLVMYMIDITLYHLHSRIAPRNIPDLRISRYEAAVRWLKAAAKGDVTAALPVLQPAQGRRFRSGSNIKNDNGY